MARPEHRRAVAGRQRGQGLTELALIMPVVAFCLIALIELSRMQRWKVSLTGAAHAGVLYASKSDGDAANTDAIKERVLAELDELSSLSDGHTTPAITVTLGAPTGDGFGKQQVTVSVSVTIPPMFTVAGFPSPWVLTESASARVLAWEPTS